MARKAANKVLILTASVGGGHEAAGRAVCSELERAGYNATMSDGLRAMSHTLNWMLVRGYCSQVQHEPRSLATVFAFTSHKIGAGSVRVLMGSLYAGRLYRKVLSKEDPGLVISTYPLVTAALGRLRKDGRLRAPAVAVISDYGVHPLWISPDTDLHLVVSECSLELAETAGGNAVPIRFPIAPEFRHAPPREEAREKLGLSPDGFVALVVGGAWGIGDVEGMARCAAEAGAYTIVVAGNNTGLKKRLEERLASSFENVRVLGWVENMPTLMSASDCLIQNAGGMTCLEAIEMGLPILIYNPILGHGELNSLTMERSGVAQWLHTAEDLTGCLRSAVRGEISLPAPRNEPYAQSLAAAVEPLFGDDRQPVVLQRAPRRFSSRLRLILAPLVVVVLFIWLAFASSGAAIATEALNLKVPGDDPPPGKVALAVRVGDPAAASAAESQARKERVPVTIFADARGARGLHPSRGITFGVAGDSGEFSAPWKDHQKAKAVATEIRRATGTSPEYFLPAPRTNLAAFADAPPHSRPVMPEQNAQGEPKSGLLVVDVSGHSPQAARQKLARAVREVRGERLRCVPLGEL